MYITNSKSLERSIAKYNLVPVASAMEVRLDKPTMVSVRFARRNTGKRGGHERNVRIAILPYIEALPYISEIQRGV